MTEVPADLGFLYQSSQPPVTATASDIGHLPIMWLSSLIGNAWLQDLVALFISFLVALSWLRLNDVLARRGLISRYLSRKMIHMGIGPLFVLCWMLYSGAPQSRWLAAVVPASITLQFLLIGVGVIEDDGAVLAMSRSGDRRELLYGPVQYGVIFVLMTLIFWLETPVGIVVLMLLSAGDGLADIIGRRYGHVPLPFNPRKSWAGSIAMLVGGFASAFIFLALFVRWGVFDVGLAASVVPLLFLCLVATVVEAVSGVDMDNVTVSVSALGAAWLVIDGLGLWQVPFILL